ncbi:MAG: sigma 54-interacting transcriptional regulator [Planctomycetes bacterium]|jgi:transcriptional regulator with GAF, ATPase, and Fis domain|nr:sigma 54-interacting transcriptional regulator [Planctomycetota bacterium]
MKNVLEILVELPSGNRLMKFDQAPVLVGRGLECDIHLEDPLASREHCQFVLEADQVWVEDLNSANGTWLRGELIQRERLSPGDMVSVGSCKIGLMTLGDRLSAAETTAAADADPQDDKVRRMAATVQSMEEATRLEEMASIAARAAVRLVNAERGFVFLLEGGEISHAVGRNFADEPVASPDRKISQTLLERAVATGKPMLLEDASSDGEFAGSASITDMGLRSLILLPLTFDGEVLGLLMVDHRLAPAAFRQTDVALLRALSGLAAAHLGAARERKRLRLMRRRLASAQKLLGRREEKIDTQSVLETIAGQGFYGLIGTSAAMQELHSSMERMLDSSLPILIEGRSGTGKELVARALHTHGPRAGSAFIVENCGALPDTLLESELFGHVKGAFTGATRDRKGRFEEASGGTLFLDEVSEMSEAMQSRLLRVLQEGEIRRVGDDAMRQVDVRVIAACNVDLRQRVKEGLFREDLFFRLNVLSLELPQLKDREGDIALLSEHFALQEAASQGRERRSFPDDVLCLLDAHSWPGNVRELRNEIRRLTLLGEGDISTSELSADIRSSHLATAPRPDADTFVDHGPESSVSLADGSLPELVEQLERRLITEALEETNGNRAQAGKRLGITRFALLRKLEKYELDL